MRTLHYQLCFVINLSFLKVKNLSVDSMSMFPALNSTSDRIIWNVNLKLTFGIKRVMQRTVLMINIYLILTKFRDFCDFKKLAKFNTGRSKIARKLNTRNLIPFFIFFQAWERAESSKSCNLIGSESGRYFTIFPAYPGGIVGSFIQSLFVVCEWVKLSFSNYFSF